MGVSEVLLCPYRCLEYKMEGFYYRSITLSNILSSTLVLSMVYK